MDTTSDSGTPDGDFRYCGDHITVELRDPQRNGGTSGPKDSERLGYTPRRKGGEIERTSG